MWENIWDPAKKTIREPEQTYTVKGGSIQDNLHLNCEILEGFKDGTKAALINLDQSKAFDRVDHRYLAPVLETAGFKTGVLQKD